VAVDAVDAGPCDRVLLVTEGFSAMTSVGRPQSPIDMAVIGFIDHIELEPDAAPSGTKPSPSPKRQRGGPPR
jgi:hypothetical protein